MKLKWLSQNSKMKNSSHNEYLVFNFGIPAFIAKDGFKTCPMAGVCASGCYAKSGTYLFSNVAKKYESRLELTKSIEFIEEMIKDITTAKTYATKKGKKCLIRVHDSGDYYNAEYMAKWFVIMNAMPDVEFYSYTKMVQMFKASQLPANFKLIYSLGGKQDSLIDQSLDRHARVFPSIDALQAEGYVNGSDDDLVAVFDQNPKIGLVFHHAKSWTNTKWSDVK